MPGVKGRSGGPRLKVRKDDSRGRKPTSLRTITDTPPGVHFLTPVVASADITLGWCTWCGSTWWEPFGITYRVATPSDEPDEGGDYFHIAAETTKPRQAEYHLKSCPLHEK